MKQELYVIGDSDTDMDAATKDYTNSVICLVLRAIQEASWNGADEVSMRFTAEAKRQCCIADVLKALRKSGYRNYEYDNYRNLLVKLRKKGYTEMKMSGITATEAREILLENSWRVDTKTTELKQRFTEIMNDLILERARHGIGEIEIELMDQMWSRGDGASRSMIFMEIFEELRSRGFIVEQKGYYFKVRF